MTLDELLAAVQSAAAARDKRDQSKANATAADQQAQTDDATFQAQKASADQAYSAFFSA